MAVNEATARAWHTGREARRWKGDGNCGGCTTVIETTPRAGLEKKQIITALQPHGADQTGQQYMDSSSMGCHCRIMLGTSLSGLRTS
jgi:hypothetical protein